MEDQLQVEVVKLEEELNKLRSAVEYIESENYQLKLLRKL